MTNAPVRVGYFTMEYPRATDTFIQREVTAVRDAGVDVDTFAVRRPGDEHMVGEEQRAERERTFYVFPPSVGTIAKAHLRRLVRHPKLVARGLRLARETARPGFRGGLYQLAYFVEAGVVADEIERRDIDHVHAHFGDVATSVAMLAAELSGRPFSFTLHGPGVFFDANLWHLGTKIEKSRFVACISWFARSQAQLLSSQEAADKLHIIHCGVDPERYDGDLADQRDDGVTRLAFVARLDHVKGLTVLLDALSAARAGGANIELTVVGDGPSRATFESHADKVGVTGAVRFAGYCNQQEVADILAASDVFVLPSFAEGVPVSLMEASASGLPVIATQVGGVSELVIDGETGFIVPPGDVDALQNRIAALGADAGLRHRMGQAGQRRVADDFCSSVEGSRLAGLFKASAALADPSASMPTLPTRPIPLARENSGATPALDAR